MDAAGGAELGMLLVGVPLPADKAQLLAYAVQQHAEPRFLAVLRSLPEREFVSLDEVVEELVPVQPGADGRPHEPREESGAPPGGDAYTELHPDTGRVRDVDELEAD
jgi:hypothetical protein